MAIDAKDYLERLPKARREAIRARADAIIAEELELSLGELRALLGKSQVEMAEEMGVQQADISKIERRTDVLLSTVRRYVQAMGGSLELVVRIPDREAVRVRFGAAEELRAPRSKGARATTRPRPKRTATG